MVARFPLLPTWDDGTESPARMLPRVERIPRTGSVLHQSPLAGAADVLSLNLTRGCAHRCAFCSVRVAPGYPAGNVVQLYDTTADRLAEELQRRKSLPRAVYICPSTDPFPPVLAVQEEAIRVVEVLAAHGIESWLMTRGFIRPFAMEVLARHRDLVKVTVGITTLQRKLQQKLEPLAAPPSLRVRQLGHLRQLGITTQVALEPLLPGITDSRFNLAPVFDALLDQGVRHVSTGYLFLRQGIAEQLVEGLQDQDQVEVMLDAFTGGPILTSGPIAAARYLPRARRQRGYATLMSLAAERGMTVSVSATTNPDFASPRRVEEAEVPRQRLLPIFLSYCKEAPHAGQ